MPELRRLLAASMLVALLTLPTALGHDESGQLTPEESSGVVSPNEGYTGPSTVPWVSFFEGVWMYGKVGAQRIDRQLPQDARIDGDWMVWIDARRNDVFIYSVSAGDGFYLTNDRFLQRNPAISGPIVVWEDYRDGNIPQIYAYDMGTGQTRKISEGDGAHRRPSIDGTRVAWETDVDRMPEIMTVDVLNGTPMQITYGRERDSDPLVLDGIVYYRTYRYNIWDIVAHDVERNRTFAVTSDVGINTAPFTNGEDVLFLNQDRGAWRLARYDPSEERVRLTSIFVSSTDATPASGEYLLQQSRDVGLTQVVARNLTSASTTHVTGSLKLVDPPLLQGKVAYFLVESRTGIQLVILEVSDFAFAKRPTLAATSPSTGASWLRPVTVRGVLSAGTQWNDPQTFTYRVDDEPPQIIAPGPQWQFTLDPGERAPGNYIVTIRATYLNGPPVETSLTLRVPQLTSGIDIEQAAMAGHQARLYAFYMRYFGDNIATWFIIPLALVLIGIVVARFVIARRGRRDELAVEYVRP